MENKTLYSIKEEHLAIVNQILEMDGEITPEQEEALKINKEELKVKSMGYLEVISSKKLRMSFADSEIKRLKAIKAREQKVVDRLEENLLEAVKTFGEFEVGLQTFKTRKSSQTIIEDPNSVPAKFKILTQTTTIDKNAIKKALNDGEKVPGAYVKEIQNLKIN